MGVKDLWKLLEPSGRPVSLEKLEGLILAIDVSVWLHQAVHGARDHGGQPLQSAHLALLFSRICKLLHYHIKPVFVFDGQTPALKQQTLIQRKQKRQSAGKKGHKAEEKRRIKYMQAKILEQLTGEESSAAVPQSSRQPDLFDLPPLPENVFNKDRSPVMEASQLSYLEDVGAIDVQSPVFASLPPELQHEILQERQEMERHSYTDPGTLPAVANDFSNYQLSKLMKRSKLSQRLEDIRKTLKSSDTIGIGLGGQSQSCEVEASRIMSSDSAHYILVRGVDLEASSQDEIEEERNIRNDDDDVIAVSVDDTLSSGTNRVKTVSESQRPQKQLSESREEMQVCSEPPSLDDTAVLKEARVTKHGNECAATTDKSQITTESNVALKLTPLPHSPGAPELTPTPHSPVVIVGDEPQSITGTELTCSPHSPGVKNDEVNVEVPQGSSFIGGPPNEKTMARDLWVEPANSASVEQGEDGDNGDGDSGVNSEVGDIGSEDYSDAGESGAMGTTVETGERYNSSEGGEDGAQCETGDEAAQGDTGDDGAHCEDGAKGVIGEVGAQFETGDNDAQCETREAGEDGAQCKTREDGAQCEAGEVGGGWEPGVLQVSPREAQWQLRQEVEQLGEEMERQRRAAAGVSSQIYREAQELLSLFGLPYIVSPMEAEAQCAYLDHTHQTHGTVTDDSDVFLFGGKRVYRHFFHQEREPTFYGVDDIESVLGLTQSRMVCLAYLLGSDYTAGVEGVGVVNAMEVIGHFREEGMEMLQKLKEWHTVLNSAPGLTLKSSLERKVRDLVVPPDFTSSAVWQAYMTPEVDESREPLQWGTPDLDLIRKYMLGHVGWSQERVDSVLLPVLKSVNTKQRSITSYFSHSATTSSPLPLPPTVIKSSRLRNVVARITGASSNQKADGGVSKSKRVKKKTSDSDSSSDDESYSEDSASRERSSGRERGRGRGRGRVRGKGKRGATGRDVRERKRKQNESSPGPDTTNSKVAKLSASSSSSES